MSNGIDSANSIFRAVCVTNRAPAPTGSGGALASYGVGAALREKGADVVYVVLGESTETHQLEADFEQYFISLDRKDASSATASLRHKLADLKPEIVWVFQAPSWPTFAPMRFEVPHVFYALDPAWEIELLRQRWRRPAKGLARKALYALRHRKKVTALRAEEKKILCEADQAGIVAGYTVSEAPGMQKRAGVPVHVCTLAYPDWGLIDHRPAVSKARALLLGNMNSVHTRYGLRYFFDKVWPTWQQTRELYECEVRVVGGGHLPDHFLVPRPHPRLRWIGYAPIIEEEWATCSAVLVPVPLTQGIRSRVVEAWCRGVPVIAHPAAEAGLPMMKSGRNYLPAERAREWVEAMCRILSDNPFREALIRNGRITFERDFAAGVRAEAYWELTAMAINKFAAKVPRQLCPA